PRGVCQVVPVRNVLPGNAAPWGQGTAFRTPGHQRWRYLHFRSSQRGVELRGGSIRDLREVLAPAGTPETLHQRANGGCPPSGHSSDQAFVLRLPRGQTGVGSRGSVYVRSRHLGGSSPLCWG